MIFDQKVCSSKEYKVISFKVFMIKAFPTKLEATGSGILLINLLNVESYGLHILGTVWSSL